MDTDEQLLWNEEDDAKLLLVNFAARHQEAVADSVDKMLRGILFQGVWLDEDGQRIYTNKVTARTLYATVLDILAGDAAIFQMENETDGIDLARAEAFDDNVVKVLHIIAALLPIFEESDPDTCAKISEVMYENLSKYWDEQEDIPED